MRWLSQNARTIEAFAALFTTIIAVVALFGIKLQLDANAAQQAAQSARDIYRAHLALAIQHPEFADPDVCKLLNSPRKTAYIAYVDHLFYASEQVLEAQPEWESGIEDHLEPHADYFCTAFEWTGYSAALSVRILSVQKLHCSAAPPVDPCQ